MKIFYTVHIKDLGQIFALLGAHKTLTAADFITDRKKKLIKPLVLTMLKNMNPHIDVYFKSMSTEEDETLFKLSFQE